MTQLLERQTAPSVAFVYSLAAMLVLFLQGCGSSMQLTSKWSEHKIQINGDLKEWSDSTLFV